MALHSPRRESIGLGAVRVVLVVDTKASSTELAQIGTDSAAGRRMQEKA